MLMRSPSNLQAKNASSGKFVFRNTLNSELFWRRQVPSASGAQAQAALAEALVNNCAAVVQAAGNNSPGAKRLSKHKLSG